jgi:hypothetical protein
MQIPLLVKLRIAIIAVIGAVGFWKIGWPLLYAWPPESPLTIVLSGQPWSVLGISVILIIAGTLAAVIVARPYITQLAPLAVLVGFTAWAIQSPRMNSLLLLHPQHQDRVEMFYRLIADTGAWFGLILLTYILTAGAARTFTKPAAMNTPPGGPPNKISAIPDSPTPRKYLSGVNPWVRNGLALISTCAVAIILLKLFARSGTVRLDQLPQLPMVSTVPAQGQIVFAVSAAFILATMAGFHLFAAPMRVFLLSPPLVAAAGYFMTAQNSGLSVLKDAAPIFVPASMAWATIMPLQYIAFGTLAVTVGFWFSVSMHAHKKTADSNPK